MVLEPAQNAKQCRFMQKYEAKLLLKWSFLVVSFKGEIEIYSQKVL